MEHLWLFVRCTTEFQPTHVMKIYDLKDQGGRVFAFEIKNMGRERLCEIVRSFPEARLIRGPKFLSEFREEEFCATQLVRTGRACPTFIRFYVE